MVAIAKSDVMFTFAGRCWIYVRPRTKWEVIINDGDIVTVGRGNVEFGISKEDFDKYFVEVRNDG